MSKTQIDVDLLNVTGGFRNVAGGITTVLSSDANGSYLESQGANNLRFYTNGAERIRIDSNGSLGVGTTPKGGAGGFNFLELATSSYMVQASNGNSYYGKNWYYNGVYKYKTANKALVYVQDDGGHAWLYAPSGAADATVAWTQAMTLDMSGNLMLGRSAAINATRDVGHFQRDQNGPTYLIVNNQSNGASASAALDFEAYGGSWQIQVPSSTTFQNPLIFTSTHAPGGEKMRIDYNGNLLVGVTSGSCHRISKTSAEGGEIFDIDGGTAYTVRTYAVTGAGANAAASGIVVGKNASTSRSINAGGTVNASGADYAEYMTKADDCGTIAKGQIVGVDSEGKLTDKWANAVSFLVKSTDPSYVGGDTWGSESAIGSERPSDTEAEDYEAQLQAFNDKLEAARAKVDRIAYCGQVPVNVTGATPGQYIVPEQDGDGIKGVLVNGDDITFAQYRKAVGSVQNILPDGRANIRVKPV